MAYETEFDEFMPLVLQWEKRSTTGTSGYGDEDTFDPPVDVRCRMEPVDKILRGVDGYEFLAVAVLYTSGVPGIGPADKITLPDGSKPPIDQVITDYDDEGPHHQRVYIH